MRFPLVFVAVVLGALPIHAGEPVKADLILKGGTLIDGTGAPGHRADVAILRDRIVAIGMFDSVTSAKIIDISGLIVAPGFIDLHTHSDSTIIKPKTRANRNYQAQGVTTVVTGNCGGGPIDIEAYFAEIDKQGAGTNVIHLIPHGSIRREILGNGDVPANARSLAAMSALIDREMRHGAWGMSTGLIYLPGRYADTKELIALSKVVAKHGGFYASHVRDEGAGLLDSVDEILTIGREAKVPVHLSHFKATGKANWGLVKTASDRILQARKSGQKVTADQYPYVASSTQLAAMVVPHWARQGTTADFIRIAADPTRGLMLRKEIQADLDERDGGSSVRIARYADKPSRVGKDLVAIARAEGTTPLEVVLDIERHGGAQAISFGMSEEDVRFVMALDYVATASDGSSHVAGSGDKPHPRAYGTFPRKVAYALDQRVISLEAAIRSNSGLPAEILGLPDRGIVKTGAIADLVVFDPKTFRDTATFDDSTRFATGVKYLFVNGIAAVTNGEPTKALPGRALRLTKDGPPDLIVMAQRIWTGDTAKPWAQAIASRAGTIIAVGSASEILALKTPQTEVLDRPKDFVIPGLIDSHAHLESLGSELDQIDLRGVATLADVQAKIKARAIAQPGEGWILGMNWDQSLWPGGKFPTAAILDEVAPGRPVWLRRVDGHAGWANSEAMKRAKVGSKSKVTSDGQMIVDEQGEPTGVFVDGAMNLVGNSVPEDTKESIRRHLLAAQERALASGLTGIHDAGISRLEAEVYGDLERQGKLKLRVYAMASPGSDPVAFASKPPAPHKPHNRFELHAIKFFIDGAMGSRGGLLFEPYSDDPHNHGLLLIDPKVLEAATVAGLKHGWQICTHAIGDKANSLVLDAYESARKAVPEATDPRLRIEHAQVVRKQDLAKFKSTGTIASMQPSHSSDDMRWADARLGPGRVDGAYAWRWFLDAGIPVAFGSDFPVEVVNPFWGVYAAITRRDAQGTPTGGWHPNQIMTLDETLRAFTAGSAFAAFQDDRVGILKIGMRTDLTLLDRDPFKIEPKATLDTKVTRTIIDGEIVFTADK